MITCARRNATPFALRSLAIAALAVAVFRSAAYAGHPDLLAWGFTFDLTLTIPLLYYAVVVRRGHASAFTLAPVFVICVVVAAHIIPRDQQAFLHELRFVTLPLDAITLWFVAVPIASTPPPPGRVDTIRLAALCNL